MVIVPTSDMTSGRMPATLHQRKGGIPVNAFYSILKRCVVHTIPKYSLLVDRSYQDLLSVTFMLQGGTLSSSISTLHAAMVAVRATTHICDVTFLLELWRDVASGGYLAELMVIENAQDS